MVRSNIISESADPQVLLLQLLILAQSKLVKVLYLTSCLLTESGQLLQGSSDLTNFNLLLRLQLLKGLCKFIHVLSPRSEHRDVSFAFGHCISQAHHLCFEHRHLRLHGRNGIQNGSTKFINHLLHRGVINELFLFDYGTSCTQALLVEQHPMGLCKNFVLFVDVYWQCLFRDQVPELPG